MTEKRWKVGASSCGNELREDLFEAYAKHGINVMEISPVYDMQGLEVMDRVIASINPKEIRGYAEKYGVEVWSLHLPYSHDCINPASPDKLFRDRCIERDKIMLNKAAEIGAKVAVFHTSAEPIDERERPEHIKHAKESIFAINEEAKKVGVVLAAEVLPRTYLGNNSAELSDIISVDETIGVNFDVNHLLIQSHKDFVEDIGRKIVTVHLSDYDFKDERHWLPGTGKIDWKELIYLLKSVDYNGSFMNEVCIKRDDNDFPYTFDEVKRANEELLDKYF